MYPKIVLRVWKNNINYNKRLLLIFFFFLSLNNSTELSHSLLFSSYNEKQQPTPIKRVPFVNAYPLCIETSGQAPMEVNCCSSATIRSPIYPEDRRRTTTLWWGGTDTEIEPSLTSVSAWKTIGIASNGQCYTMSLWHWGKKRLLAEMLACLSFL